MPIIDTLLKPKWIIPIEPHNKVLEEHFIAIHKGKIAGIFPNHQLEKTAFTCDNIIELTDHVVMPGFVNAHTHAPMNLLRGIADDVPLMTWLNEAIWPAEKKYLNETFALDGSYLAIAEMILGGTTCFNDHYPFSQSIAKAADLSKIRCTVGMFMIDHPSAYANNFSEYVEKEMAWYQDFKDHPLITVALAPHSPYGLSDESMRTLRNLQETLRLRTHMHVHESEDEIKKSLEKHKRRPLERLADFGLLSDQFTGVHLCRTTESDIAIMAKHQINVVSCPQSNAKLASGWCPVHELQAAGINLALGTDSAASNNDLNMFAEMQMAGLVTKQLAGEASALPAADILRMATLGGARAMGLQDTIGSIEVGKAADLIAIDLKHPTCQPVYNPISQIIYAAGRELVSHVWVNGHTLLDNRRFTQLPIREIMEKAETWGSIIKDNLQPTK